MIRDQLSADFLLRLAQERETLLAYLRAERVAGDDNGARNKLEAECLRRVGVPFGVVRKSAPEDLVALIQRGRDMTFRSIILAELLLLDAEISEKAGNLPQAVGSRLQAFCLIAEAIRYLNSDEQAAYQAKLEVLTNELNSISDDPYLRGKIAEYRAKANS